MLPQRRRPGGFGKDTEVLNGTFVKDYKYF